MLSIEDALRIMVTGRQYASGFVHPTLSPEGEKDMDSAAEAMMLDLAGRADDAADTGEPLRRLANHQVIRRLVRDWGTWPTFWHLSTRWSLGVADECPDPERVHAMLADVGRTGVPEDPLTLARVMLTTGADVVRRAREQQGGLGPEEVTVIWSAAALMAHSLVVEDPDLHHEGGPCWWVLDLLVGAALTSRYLYLDAQDAKKARRRPARTRPGARRKGHRRR